MKHSLANFLRDIFQAFIKFLRDFNENNIFFNLFKCYKIVIFYENKFFQLIELLSHHNTFHSIINDINYIYDINYYLHFYQILDYFK